MRRVSVIAGTALTALIAACDPMGGFSGISGTNGTGQQRCGWLFDPRPCVALEIYPSALNILNGDTVYLTTLSDSGFARSTWTMTGSAAAFVGAGGELSNEITVPDAAALLKAVNAGRAEIRVQSAGSAHSATRTVTVADSSELLTLALAFSWYQSDTIKVGSQFFVLWELRDASGTVFRARPTSWSSSDALVASMEREPCAGVGCGAPFRANAAGTVDVIASFLGLRDTLRITVVP